jgi:hypothetical protein
MTGQSFDMRATPQIIQSLVAKLDGLVETREGVSEISAGQAVIAERGEWIRYSTPGSEGAEYIAVCLPAFSPQNVHRDAS